MICEDQKIGRILTSIMEVTEMHGRPVLVKLGGTYLIIHIQYIQYILKYASMLFTCM